MQEEIEGNEYSHKLVNQSEMLGHNFSPTQSQYTRSPMPRKVLEDTPISDISVSSEHSNFTKGRKVKIFSPKLGKTNKQPHNFTDSAMVQYLFNCATRTIDSPKSGNNVTRGNIFDIPRGQRNAEKRCKFSSKKSGVSVSELTVFGRKKGGRNHSVVDLKELNKILPYPHFKIECMYVSVKFTEYYTKSATRESEKDKNPMQRASREGTSNRQRNKQINRAVIVHSIISSSRVSAVHDFITPANSINDFQIFSRGTIEPIKTGNGRATLVYINLSSWNRKSLISLPVQLIIISDLSNQGRRHYAKSKQQEIHGLRKRVNST